MYVDHCTYNELLVLHKLRELGRSDSEARMLYTIEKRQGKMCELSKNLLPHYVQQNHHLIIFHMTQQGLYSSNLFCFDPSCKH